MRKRCLKCDADALYCHDHSMMDHHPDDLARIAELEGAIKAHRAQSEDVYGPSTDIDGELYKVLGDE